MPRPRSKDERTRMFTEKSVLSALLAGASGIWASILTTDRLQPVRVAHMVKRAV